MLEAFGETLNTPRGPAAAAIAATTTTLSFFITEDTDDCPRRPFTQVLERRDPLLLSRDYLALIPQHSEADQAAGEASASEARNERRMPAQLAGANYSTAPLIPQLLRALA